MDIDFSLDEDSGDFLVWQTMDIVERVLAVDDHVELTWLASDAQLEASSLLEQHWTGTLLVLPSSSLSISDNATSVEAWVDVEGNGSVVGSQVKSESRNICFDSYSLKLTSSV